MSNINVAIDGPAGAGKSTIAKELAKKLGFIYIDTGALYRAIAYYTYSSGIKDFSKDGVVPLLRYLTVNLEYIDGLQRVFVNNIDISDKIRTPEISLGTSKISAVPEVRQFLLDLQRNIAQCNDVIMDGRDIGTVVLPNADLKIFLTASAEERARRRYTQIEKEPDHPSFEEVLRDINQRDYDDSHRKIAPLQCPKDAILIDSTNLSQLETIHKILWYFDRKIAGLC